MNIYLTYTIIFVLLLVLELVYFRIADRFNIIDKPNQRSSHSSIVLRGGGIIFLLGVWIWAAFASTGLMGAGIGFRYPLFLVAVTLAAGISFVDDVHSLPDAVRLVVQFVAMGLLIAEVYLSARDGGLFAGSGLLVLALMAVVALVVCVGATNIYNFMDGINGITAGYSLAVLVPLLLMNGRTGVVGEPAGPFMDGSFLVVMILAVLVFAFFNFRPRGKAKCFAGDVGSVGIAFVLLFGIGMLIAGTGDVTWLAFLLVYGVDGCMTILHRIQLHEPLGEAHRKHAYQIMANELGMSHVLVSLLYIIIQLIISLIMVYLIPNTIVAHWLYLVLILVILSLIYILFMKKFYHLHEEYLESIKK